MPNYDSLARGIWPWLVALLGVYLLISNGSPEASDYGFYGWLLGFPFVIEAQKARNRKEDENGQG